MADNAKTKANALKILQVATFYAPVVGGMETQIEDLSKKLMEQGHQVEVLTTDAARGGKRVERLTDEYDGLKVKRVPVLLSFTQFHKFAPGFFYELRQRDYDIVHVHGIRKPELYMALLWAKIRKKKIVVSTHNPFTTVGRKRVIRMLLALHDITVGWLFMRFVDHYFLLHASERKILKQLGVNPKKTTVVGNAVQDEFFSEVTSSRDSFLQTFSLKQNYERIVLAVGRLNEVKGFQNLQYAVENLPDTLFIVVGGDDGYAEKLKQIYADYDNIIFSETFLPREQLREYYRHADIFVLPSIHEPFGIVLLEAMAQHTAIIASNNGGPVGILNPEGDENIARNASNYGVLVNPNNQELWYERIKLFVEDENLLRLYKNKAYKRVREFKWKNVFPKYLKVYNTLYT